MGDFRDANVQNYHDRLYVSCRIREVLDRLPRRNFKVRDHSGIVIYDSIDDKFNPVKIKTIPRISRLRDKYFLDYRGLENMCTVEIFGNVHDPKNLFEGSKLTKLIIHGDLTGYAPGMFKDCKNLTTVEVTGLVRITHAWEMFSGATKFNANVSYWFTDKCLEFYMDCAFKNAWSFNQNVRGLAFDVAACSGLYYLSYEQHVPVILNEYIPEVLTGIVMQMLGTPEFVRHY